MFNVRIVGTANAIAAGWGNMGGGATHFIMPLIYEGIKHHVPGYQAWRWAFFVPGGIYVLFGLLTLALGQEHASGKDYRTLKKVGGSSCSCVDATAAIPWPPLHMLPLLLCWGPSNPQRPACGSGTQRRRARRGRRSSTRCVLTPRTPAKLPPPPCSPAAAAQDGTLKAKGNIWPVLKAGMGNYRAWILALTYGYSFGVELTVDNQIVEYLFDQVRPAFLIREALGVDTAAM
jgi:hypothetical protein